MYLRALVSTALALGVFVTGVASADASSPEPSAPTASRVSADGRISEWRAAWSALGEADRKAITSAWTTAVEAAKSLTPDQRAGIKVAVTTFAASLDSQQVARIQKALGDLRAAMKSLSQEDKTALLKQVSQAIQSVQARGDVKQRLEALVGAST